MHHENVINLILLKYKDYQNMKKIIKFIYLNFLEYISEPKHWKANYSYKYIVEV